MDKHKASRSILPLLCAAGGFAVGVLVNDVPYIQFKREVDLSTLVSLVGLIGAIYIVPFLINAYFSRRDNTNQVIISDMDSCLEKLEAVAALYKKLYLKDDLLSSNDMKELLSDLRRATNCLGALATALDGHQKLKDFRTKVLAQYNEETYKDLTENTREGVSINDQNYLGASRSIEKTISRIKKYRYLTYTG